MNHGGDPVPIVLRRSQFENLLMALRQATLLPPHPLACINQEVAAMHAEILANVEDDLPQAALGQLAFKTAKRIVDSAPVNLPRRLIEDFYPAESGVNLLQLFEGLQGTLDQLALFVVSPNGAH